MEIRNRKASHDYQILETVEAGLQLTGAEVKSIRGGKVSLEGAHVRIEVSAGALQAWLVGMHTAAYLPAGDQEVSPLRPKKLLLHRRQIQSFWQQSRSRGLTMIPLRVYGKHGWIKVEIGLARGKKMWQKKEQKKRRDIARDVQRTLRSLERSS